MSKGNNPQQEQSTMENINIYLKVRNPASIDQSYYSISPDNRIFTLHDPMRKSLSSKSVHFEMNNIYTEKDDNLTIFNEVSTDCFTNSLKNRQHYTFISYGATSSDKFHVHFGGSDYYTNTTQRGVFPRYLQKFSETIDSNEEYKEEYYLNMSFFSVYGTKLVDLLNYYGKDITNITENDIVASGLDIKTNSDIIYSLKKMRCNDIDQVILFTQNLFCYLRKQELELDEGHFFSLSHFCFVIYVMKGNEEVVSTSNFLLLASSENLPTKVTNPNFNPRDSIQNTKATVDKQAAFISVVNAISNLKTMQKMEKAEETKLSIVLAKICFNPSIKMEFRIIGSILPNTGMHNIVNDTLVFLFRCKKIVRKRPDLDTVALELKHDLKREDIVYNLESKLKQEQKLIQELNERIDIKQEKINSLEANYRRKVETFKEKFYFVGDANLLISGNEYTKEGKLARSIRDAIDNNRIKGNRIDELETKVKELEEQNKKLCALHKLKLNDTTMIDLYNQFKETNIATQAKLMMSHEQSEQLDQLKLRNSQLEELFNQCKMEYDAKGIALMKIPQLLQVKEEEECKSMRIKEDSMKKIDLKFKKEIKTLQEQNMKQMKKQLALNTEMDKKKDKEIEEVNIEYTELKKKAMLEKETLGNELIVLGDLAEYLINVYNTSFDKRKYGNNINSANNFNWFISMKQEFEKTIELTLKSLNKYQFPILHRLLKNKANESKTLGQPNHLGNSTNIRKPIHDIPPSSIDSSRKNEVTAYPFITPCTNSQINDMSYDELKEYTLTLFNQLSDVQSFSQKYIQHKQGFQVKEFDYSNEYIGKLQVKLEKFKEKLNDQVRKNQDNLIKIQSHNRTKEKLSSQNKLFKNKLTITKSKSINASPYIPYQRADTEPGEINQYYQPINPSLSVSTLQHKIKQGSITANNFYTHRQSKI